MKKLNNIFKIILVLLVLILAYTLRRNNYNLVPLAGQSLDEYSYSWTGLSLIRIGIPVGISGINGYPFNDYRYINTDRIFQSTAKGNPVAINYPWFDHPPLMGLVTGGWAYLKGARVFEDTNAYIIRQPMIMAGTISVLLVIILATILFNFWTGITAGIIYATWPLAVVGSRMIQGENGVIPCMLLSMIFGALFIKKKQYYLLYLAAIMAGIGTLFKLSGIVSFLIIVFYLFYFIKDKKKALWDSFFFLIIAGSITSLFLIFGLVWDGKTFFNILFSNSSRFYGLGAGSFRNLLVETRLTHEKYFTEAWSLAAWIGVALLLIKNKLKDYYIIIPVFAYFIVYILFGSQPYGWYAFPFFPLLAIAISRVLIKKGNVFVKFTSLLIPLGFGITKIIDITSFQKYSGMWRLGLMTIIFGLLINRKIFKINRLIGMLLCLMFISVIWLNIRYLSMLSVDYWYQVN